MVTVKAIKNFNNGKGLVKSKGDVMTIDKETADFLLLSGIVKKEKTSHKEKINK